jgi:oxaloacetate decarboxylase alpha subunit
MKRVKFIDTTLRDGQQSLWALGMRTGWMLPALPNMDEAGFEAMEFFVPGVGLKKMIRDLGEDPWQWLKLGTSAVRKTPLRLHAYRGQAFSQVPKSIDMLLVQKVMEYGLTTVRTSSPWNNFDKLKEDVEDLRKMGMNTVVNLIYSVSPRHTDEYFVERAKAAAALKPYRMCLKDVGGLLKPETVKKLIPKILGVIGDIPLELHTHGNNGLASFNVVEAVRCGVRYVHTAIPPLANGPSQPSVFDVARDLRALGYDPDIDLLPLKSVEKHFTDIAKRENLPIGEVLEYDESTYSHQIPGGMMYTLRLHLRQAGIEHRIAEVLEEVPRVRADFGYPIMVTPFSQFVATQASLNVMFGERYKEVTDQVIHYALGRWGDEAMEVMQQNVRAKILDRPRAKELSKQEYPDLSLKELRRKFGENLTDEELILATYVDEEAVKIAREAPAPQP